MPDSISVSITADATQLRSALARAQADVRAYGAEIRRTASELRGAGDEAKSTLIPALDQASAKYNAAKAAAESFRAALGEGSSAARGFSSETSSAFARIAGETEGSTLRFRSLERGIARVGEEVATGDFSRLPEALIRVAERSGAAEIAMEALGSTTRLMSIGAIAAITAIVAVVVLLIRRTNEAREAMANMANAAVLAGHDAEAAVAHVKSMAASMAETEMVSEREGTQISAHIERIGGVSDSTKAKIAAIAPALKLALNAEDAKKAGEQIAKVFSDTSSLERFARENNVITEKFRADWDKAAGDLPKMAEVAADALTSRMKPAMDAYIAQTKRAEDSWRIQSMMAVQGAMSMTHLPSVAVGVTPEFKPEHLTLPSGTEAPDARTKADQEAVEKLNTSNRERAQLENEVEAAKRRVAAAATDDERKEAEAAVRIGQAKLDSLKTADQTEAWQKYSQEAQDAANKAVMAFQGQHVKNTQIAEAETRAQIDIWKKAAQDQTLTEQQRTQAAATAARYEAQLVRETSSAKSGAAKSDLSAKLAELSAEQAANKDNFDRVLALEDQKIELLKAAGSKYTAQYYNELKRREDMVRQHTAAVVKLDEQSLAEKKTLMEQAIAQRREELQVEVDLHRMSVQQMLADLRSFTDAQHAEWLKQAEQFKSSLDQNSAEYKKFVATLETTQAKWVTESKRMDVEAAQDAKKQFDEIVGPIKSAFNTAFSGVIQGTQTLQQALGKMGQSIAISYLEKFF
ncbi:MAG TPA: hypothetical protein VMU08_04870, partial [Rhizomicrobium sp.]|nr:hypothetical protein [Rhizomicrobium sp.]